MRISVLVSEVDHRSNGYGNLVAIYFLRRSTSKNNQIADHEHTICLKEIFPPKFLAEINMAARVTDYETLQKLIATGFATETT